MDNSSFKPGEIHYTNSAWKLFILDNLRCHLPVTSVSQRGDNQPRCVTQVFVAIVNICRDHTHNHIIFPVVTQLCQPIKFQWTVHLLLNKICHSITSWKYDENKSNTLFYFPQMKIYSFNILMWHSLLQWKTIPKTSYLLSLPLFSSLNYFK